jgi:hypothetical protein
MSGAPESFLIVTTPGIFDAIPLTLSFRPPTP